ncbi:MAG: twin-arginine translocase TatA/TatE family subunit [Candidatus Omnitrophota bacterium]
MFKFGMGELIVIFLIVLLLFGASRLPEIGKGLAKAIKEFKKAGKEIQNDIEEVTKDDENKKA